MPVPVQVTVLLPPACSHPDKGIFHPPAHLFDTKDHPIHPASLFLCQQDTLGRTYIPGADKGAKFPFKAAAFRAQAVTQT